MSNSVHHLRVLAHSEEVDEIDLVSELFHRINRIIPEGQQIKFIPPTTTVREAVELMRELNYSQLPVIQGNEVLGVFSYRSFAKEAAAVTFEKLKSQSYAPGDLTVDECLEKFDFANVTDDMDRVFRSVERDNGVLIGSPENLIGLLSPIDILLYLYNVANPFVMLSEIELALRALIRRSLSVEEIKNLAKKCLLKLYGTEERIPLVLEDMTFDNYRALISYGETWSKFEKVFGGSRGRAGGKLAEISEIRNYLFHFRRKITVEDYEVLRGHRDWLLSKVKQAKQNGAEEQIRG